MSNSEGSARVFAGIATFFVVFFLPKLIVPIFEESSLTVLWGLVALATHAAARREQCGDKSLQNSAKEK